MKKLLLVQNLPERPNQFASSSTLRRSKAKDERRDGRLVAPVRASNRGGQSDQANGKHQFL